MFFIIDIACESKYRVYNLQVRCTTCESLAAHSFMHKKQLHCRLLFCSPVWFTQIYYVALSTNLTLILLFASIFSVKLLKVLKNTLAFVGHYAEAFLKMHSVNLIAEKKHKLMAENMVRIISP